MVHQRARRFLGLLAANHGVNRAAAKAWTVHVGHNQVGAALLQDPSQVIRVRCLFQVEDLKSPELNPEVWQRSATLPAAHVYPDDHPFCWKHVPVLASIVAFHPRTVPLLSSDSLFSAAAC